MSLACMSIMKNLVAMGIIDSELGRGKNRNQIFVTYICSKYVPENLRPIWDGGDNSQVCYEIATRADKKSLEKDITECYRLANLARR